MEDDVITLRLLPHIAEHLKDQLDQLPTNVPVALLTDLDPTAQGCLVWQPGQSQLSAITRPSSSGTRLCGCFALFVPDQATDHGRGLEDGFAMLLTNASWAAIRRAIATSQNVSIPATEEGMSFQLQRVQTTYQNPVDGRTYHSEGGWETFRPRDSRARLNNGPVRVKGVILLTPNQEMGVRIGPRARALADYFQAIIDIVQTHSDALAPIEGHDLIVQFEVWPDGKVEVRFASRVAMDFEALRALQASLLALAPPKVEQEPIEFQIVFAIGGGSSVPG